MASLNDIVPSGVITGDDVLTLLEYARANSFAIPAVNCTRYVLLQRKMRLCCAAWSSIRFHEGSESGPEVVLVDVSLLSAKEAWIQRDYGNTTSGGGVADV